MEAICLARPERAGFVSLGPEHLATEEDRREAPHRLRVGMGRIAREMRARGYGWEDVHVVEISPFGRPHAHFLQRGSDVPGVELRAVAHANGVGWSQMSRIRNLPVIVRYVLKAPIRALDMEPEGAVEVLWRHKMLNGNRLVTATRGFWRVGTMTQLSGVAKARGAAYSDWLGSRNAVAR